MMNRTTIVAIFTISLLVLGGCSSKWDQPPEGLTEDLRTRFETAITEQEEVLVNDSENLEAHFGIAYNNQLLGNYKEAVKGYKKIINKDPRHLVALNNIVDIYEQVGEYDQSAKYMKDLFSYYPGRAESVTDAVRILLKVGDPDNADLALDRYLATLKEASKEENPEFISKLKQSIFNYRNQNKNAN